MNVRREVYADLFALKNIIERETRRVNLSGNQIIQHLIHEYRQSRKQSYEIDGKLSLVGPGKVESTQEMKLDNIANLVTDEIGVGMTDKIEYAVEVCPIECDLD